MLRACVKVGSNNKLTRSCCLMIVFASLQTYSVKKRKGEKKTKWKYSWNTVTSYGGLGLGTVSK